MLWPVAPCPTSETFLAIKTCIVAFQPKLSMFYLSDSPRLGLPLNCPMTLLIQISLHPDAAEIETYRTSALMKQPSCSIPQLCNMVFVRIVYTFHILCTLYTVVSQERISPSCFTQCTPNVCVHMCSSALGTMRIFLLGFHFAIAGLCFTHIQLIMPL